MQIRLSIIIFLLAIKYQAYAIASNSPDMSTDTIIISIPEAFKRAQKHYLPLNSMSKEVDMTKAALKQEKLWDNPEIEISHNINNPVTQRYFETNRDGETDIQLTQRIYIGGQHNQRVRKATEELNKAQYERNNIERLLCRELSVQMIQLSCFRKKVDVIDKEITSMEEILHTYKEQEKKGNIAKAELLRIENQRLQLLQEKTELMAEITQLQQSLAIMTGIGYNTNIIPDIDYNKNVEALSQTALYSIKNELCNRADILAGNHDVLSAEHDVKLQKANALPEINLTGEWDKNGNIGHNFFAIGLSFTLPVFNRNQGNIKAAHASLESKRIQQAWNIQQAEAEIETNWKKLQTSLALVNEAESSLSENNALMVEAAQLQYMKHNISLLELLDYYQTYKDINFLIIESRSEVLQNMAEMDIKIL